jgi:hypothetical protein
MNARVESDIANYHFDPAEPDLIRNPYEPYYRLLREQPGPQARRLISSPRGVRMCASHHEPQAFSQGNFVHNISSH